MTKNGRTILGSAIVPLRFLCIMWVVFTLDFLYGYSLSVFGVKPRTIEGLIGIATAPMLHGSFLHIMSNTFPLLFLGIVLFYYYHRIAYRVFLSCYFFTNILVWIFAREANHIGASGLIYGIASFLMFYGFFKRDFKSIFISVVVIFIYGGMFYGLLPSNPNVSFESHIAGAIVGLLTANNFKNTKA